LKVARVLFARLPEHGQVKTRLAADLDDDGAFELYKWLLRVQQRVFKENTLPNARYTNFVYFAPRVPRLIARLKFYPDLAGFDLRFRAQCEGDLGARLTHAVTEVLKNHDLACIWGADVPTLPESIFGQSVALAPQSVLTPARDGGYAFISLARSKFSPAVFERIRWSTVHTGRDQIRALQTAGITPVIRGRVCDLDRAHDLTRVIRELEEHERTADLTDLTETLQRLHKTTEN